MKKVNLSQLGPPGASGSKMGKARKNNILFPDQSCGRFQPDTGPTIHNVIVNG